MSDSGAVDSGDVRPRFDGRVAIITGASQGIGRAAAQLLARHGASLCLVALPADRDDLEIVAADASANEHGAVTVLGDVAEEETARAAVNAALRSFGRLDHLLSNAGIFFTHDVLTAPVAEFDRLMAVNVRGNYLMATAAARAMASGEGGSIVLAASSAAVLGEERMAAYNASKAAVAGLARSLSVDLAQYGIRVNAVAPGWIDTPQNEGVRDDPAAWSRHRARIPMDRMGRPEEVAAIMAFLLSDDASYLTGALVPVDGGLTAGLRSSDWDAVTVPPEPRPRRVIPVDAETDLHGVTWP